MWWKFFTEVRTGQYKLSTLTWLALAGTVTYTLWPIDFLPDFILGPIGMIDDLGMWGVLLVIVTNEKNKWEAQLAYNGVIIDAEPVR